MGTDIHLVAELNVQVFHGVISSLVWGSQLLNVLNIVFVSSSNVIDLVCVLNNFQPFLAFNLYIASLHKNLSAFTSLLKHCVFSAVESSMFTAVSVVPDYFKKFLFHFFLPVSWAHNHWDVEQCWEMFPLKHQVLIFLFLFCTSCCLPKTRATKSLLISRLFV